MTYFPLKARSVDPRAERATVAMHPSGPRPAGLGLKLAAANSLGTMARWSRRGDGSSLPGRALTRLAPGAVTALAGQLPYGCVAVSATNGKTTTANLLATMATDAGTRVVHNRTGANLPGGIAATLAASARQGGRTIDGDLGVFEIDELWLDELTTQLHPRLLVLGNLFRDQLDRCGELETIARRWRTLVERTAGSTRVIACADDPRIAAIARRTETPLYFGVDDSSLAGPDLTHASDPAICPECGTPPAYDHAFIAHLGHWRCPGCGSGRPAPDVAARAVTLHGSRSSSFLLDLPDASVPVELPLPGIYNVYNAVGAAAAAWALGVSPDAIAGTLNRVEPAFGRAEHLQLRGRPVSIFLVKNPAGANEVIRTLSLDSGPLTICGLLNDGPADGRDISWIWDVDWETVAPQVEAVTVGGSRGADLGVRVKHAGVRPERIQVVPDIVGALDTALASGNGRLFVLPTYTALLRLRRVLDDRRLQRSYP